MGSSRRQFAVLPDRLADIFRRGIGIFVDFVWFENNYSAVSSLLPSPEPEISSFHSSPGDVCHHRKPSLRAKLSHQPQSPCIAASKNPKEWIA